MISVALLRRQWLTGAWLAAAAASVLPRGGTLACLTLLLLGSLPRAACRYPYPRRRAPYRRIALSYLLGAAVFLALTAFEGRVIPPPLQKSGAAVFAVCATADGVRMAFPRRVTNFLIGALFLIDVILYLR